MYTLCRRRQAVALIFIAAFALQARPGTIAAETSFDLAAVLEVNVGTNLGQCRAAPVDLGDRKGIFVAYCEDAEIDPYVEMFFLPSHRMKLMVMTLDGAEVWKTELGAGVIPGIWFTPFFPFDLDGDGVDGIWFVNNVDDEHPLSLRGRRLECLDARSGRRIGQWSWPAVDRNQSPSHTFRNFILGGHVRGAPVLVTAQGTYGPMTIQGWDPDMTQRWEYAIGRETPGLAAATCAPLWTSTTTVWTNCSGASAASSWIRAKSCSAAIGTVTGVIPT
jgi:hypothetical protein